MKHTILLLTGAIVLIFSCSKNSTNVSETDQFEKATKFSGAEEFITMHDQGSWTPLPNGLALAQGGVFEYYDTASDPRVTGKVILHVNALFDSTISGEFSGIGELTTNIGGSWDLKIVGERIAAKGSFAEAIGHGKGELEGLIAYWTYERLEPEKDDFTFEGYIIE